MTTPATYASVNQFVLIGKETTAGTAPTTGFTQFVNDSFTPEDKVVYLSDKALRGVMGEDSFNEIQGVKTSDLSFSSPVFMDSIGNALLNIMGQDDVTGSAAPYTHKFSLLNGVGSATQPATHTLAHMYGPTATSYTRNYTGVCFSSLEFDFTAATGLLTFSGKATGWGSSPAASAPTLTDPTVKPQAAWTGQATIGGSAVANMVSGKVTITREVEPEFTLQNSQNPYVIQRGGLSATFSATFIANDETYLLDMLNNTQPSLNIAFTATSGQTITFSGTQAAFLTAKPNFGKKAVEFDVTGKFVFNSTDIGTTGGLGPLTVSVTNSITSY